MDRTPITCTREQRRVRLMALAEAIESEAVTPIQGGDDGGTAEAVHAIAKAFKGHTAKPRKGAKRPTKPRGFIMDLWGATGPCGTAACAAGTAVLHPMLRAACPGAKPVWRDARQLGPKMPKGARILDGVKVGDDTYNVGTAATGLLGLTDAEAVALFREWNVGDDAAKIRATKVAEIRFLARLHAPHLSAC